jgi:hypothetical protein
MARIGSRLAWAFLLGAISSCAQGPSYYEKEKALRDVPTEALKAQGAKFVLKQYFGGHSAWSIDLQGLTITNEMLEHLKMVGQLTELNLSKSTISDEQLALINQRPTSGFLLVLDLSKTGITDAGLDKLNDLGWLQTLVLKDTKVTPTGVARFKKNRTDDPKIQQGFKNPKVVQ